VLEQRRSDFQSDMSGWKPDLLKLVSSPVYDNGDDEGRRFPA